MLEIAILTVNRLLCHLQRAAGGGTRPHHFVWRSPWTRWLWRHRLSACLSKRSVVSRGCGCMIAEGHVIRASCNNVGFCSRDYTVLCFRWKTSLRELQDGETIWMGDFARCMRVTAFASCVISQPTFEKSTFIYWKYQRKLFWTSLCGKVVTRVSFCRGDAALRRDCRLHLPGAPLSGINVSIVSWFFPVRINIRLVSAFQKQLEAIFSIYFQWDLPMGRNRTVGSCQSSCSPSNPQSVYYYGRRILPTGTWYKEYQELNVPFFIKTYHPIIGRDKPRLEQFCSLNAI